MTKPKWLGNEFDVLYFKGEPLWPGGGWGLPGSGALCPRGLGQDEFGRALGAASLLKQGLIGQGCVSDLIQKDQGQGSE